MERIENPRIEPRRESVAVELKVRDSTAPPTRADLALDHGVNTDV
jgi:hypothetical protein